MHTLDIRLLENSVQIHKLLFSSLLENPGRSGALFWRLTHFS